jgi:hypothetical protein
MMRAAPNGQFGQQHQVLSRQAVFHHRFVVNHHRPDPDRMTNRAAGVTPSILGLHT